MLTDVTCVVSALQGLTDVIIDAQYSLIEAADAAGVLRFIPSDYSTNFKKLPEGENRNFDLRRAFLKKAEGSFASITSIFNGAFAEILSYNTPLLDFKKKTIGYWGDDPDWKMDFTTMDDTAAFTANAAFEDSTPSDLNIAGFQVSPNELLHIANKHSDEEYKLVRMGSLEEFAAYNKQSRAADPNSENDIFPRWQSGQYMHDMFRSHHEKTDNDRYPEIKWTGAEEFIKQLVKS